MTFKEKAYSLLNPIRRRARSPSSTDRPESILSDGVEQNTASKVYNQSPVTPTSYQLHRSGSGSGHRRAVSVTSTFSRIRAFRHSSAPLRPHLGPKEPVFSQDSSVISSTPGSEPTRYHDTLFTHSNPPPPQQPHDMMGNQRKANQSKKIDHFDALAAEEHAIRVANPTPFSSPSQNFSAGHPEVRSWQPSSAFDDPFLANHKPLPRSEIVPTNHGQISSVRPSSRASSQSSRDRALPPPSFPTNFYDRIKSSQDFLDNSKRTSNYGSHGGRSELATKRYTISSMPIQYDDTQTSQQESSNHQPTLNQHPEIYHSPHKVTDRTSPARRQHSNTSSMSHISVPSRPDPLVPAAMPRTRPNTLSTRYSLNKDFSFHTTVHHYSDCIHTSPPVSRPLNVQPHLEYLAPTLPDEDPTARSIIPGSCFDCDTATRRHQETHVLLRFSPEISRLADDLAHLVSKFDVATEDLDSSMSLPQTPTKRGFANPFVASPGTASTRTAHTAGSGSTFDTMNTNAATDATSTTSEPAQKAREVIEQHMLDLEALIEELKIQRAQEVDNIWQGYSARWGPGTLGVVKDRRGDGNTSRSTSRAGSRSRSVSVADNVPEIVGVGEHRSHLRNLSRTSSTQSSPRKTLFPSSLRQEHVESQQSWNSLPTTPAAQKTTLLASPAIGRSASHTNAIRTPARSLRMSLSRHGRDNSTDSAASSVSGVRSSSRTETGISYASLDTPVGRMKVNWVRDPDES